LINFQSDRNVTKIVPLRPSHLLDSGGIFTFANGVRMEEISRSVRQAKQAKFWDAEVDFVKVTHLETAKAKWTC
jgi:hypothetical protein